MARLAPLAQCAFVRRTADPAQSASGAHNHRELYKIANRRHVSIYGVRALEESGSVDAQAILFVPVDPDALPVGWTSWPFVTAATGDCPETAK